MLLSDIFCDIITANGFPTKFLSGVGWLSVKGNITTAMDESKLLYIIM